LIVADELSFGRQAEAGVVDRTAGGDPTDWESGLTDVSDMSLEELGSLLDGDESPLANSLRRVADELADNTEQIAGFNSAL
jgi:FXSXX-COOH protein